MHQYELLDDAAPYLYALFTRLAPHDKEAGVLYEQIQSTRSGVEVIRSWDLRRVPASRDDAPQPSAGEWKRLGAFLKERAGQSSAQSALQRNISTVGRVFALDEAAARHYGCLLTALSNFLLLRVWNELGDVNPKRNTHTAILSLMLNEKYEHARPYLDPNGPLVRNGLLELDTGRSVFRLAMHHGTSDLEDVISIPGNILAALDSDVHDAEALRSRIIGPAAKSELLWSDFDHVAPDRDLMLEVLRGAVRERALGVNILVYGPPGTGKTELCKVVAARAGLTLHQLGGGEGCDEKEKRITPLLRASKLFAREHECLLLFDEMEDILPAGAHSFFGMRESNLSGKKFFLNNLLESNPVPTLWTCNEIRAFDPALLRRMMLAVEVNPPPAPVRARVLERTLKQAKLSVPAAEVRALAEGFEAPPALAASAVRAAALASGGVRTIQRAMNGLAKVVNHGRPLCPPQRAPENYDPALLRLAGNEDAPALLEKLGALGAKPFSLCLSGSPGTGKSAFVRALAERMELPVVQKRASDLLDKFVGGTEHKIAAAFERAANSKSFLIFDEADSLLRNRQHARYAWEVTQVNEMLTWMETHPLPFACTTNLMGSLDPATLRRFVFKFEAQPLDAVRTARCFLHFFGLEPPVGLAQLQTLTPGDFALVQKQARVFGEAGDAAALLERLRAECEAKEAHGMAPAPATGKVGGSYV